MKLFDSRLDNHRVTDGPLGSPRGSGGNGAFILPAPTGARLIVVVSDGSDWGQPTDGFPDGLPGEPWEHVSVHVDMAKRCPTWAEMSYVKSLFWGEEETVLEYHPPKSEYVNTHPHTLHLWRPKRTEIPLPPRACV